LLTPFCPYPDQWQLLASVRRVQPDQVEWIVNDATRRGQVVEFGMSLADGEADDEPWTLLPSKEESWKTDSGPFPRIG